MVDRSLRVWIAVVVSLVAGFAAAQEAPAAGKGPVPHELGGATTISYHRVGAMEFRPGSSSMAWTRDGVNDRLISLEPGPASFYANPHLPGGAKLTSIELDSCDTNTFGQHMILFLNDCDYTGNCPDNLAFLSSADNQGDCGFVRVELADLNYTIDNDLKSLAITVLMSSGDDTNQLAGAILGYQLQVSPAPGNATFADVPVGSQYFQFVEALVASGVTAGCGNGNYCPDAPLTRGQMAVFIAKALGLNWSQ
jgi:hypothetical protein